MQAAAATSSGRPSRPSGICWTSAPRCSSESVRVMSVSINPGAMQLTVMLRLATSRASDLEKR